MIFQEQIQRDYWTTSHSIYFIFSDAEKHSIYIYRYAEKIILVKVSPNCNFVFELHKNLSGLIQLLFFSKKRSKPSWESNFDPPSLIYFYLK